MSTLIEVSLYKILQTRTYTVMILSSEQKKFAIYMEPHVGEIAQAFFSNEKSERPQTFDFIDRHFLGLDLSVLRISLFDLQKTTFFAKILYEQNQQDLKHLIEVHSRPSDALLVALRHHVPIYCSEKVLEETVPYIDIEN